MFEKRHHRLAPSHTYYKRLLVCVFLALGILTISLILGVFGYHYYAKLDYISSLLNASMILTGMGPINDMHSSESKVFASIYAIYSGVIFLIAMAITIAPIFHRFLHKFHLADEDINHPLDGR